jgi:hypothetical protein
VLLGGFGGDTRKTNEGVKRKKGSRRETRVLRVVRVGESVDGEERVLLPPR